MLECEKVKAVKVPNQAIPPTNLQATESVKRLWNKAANKNIIRSCAGLSPHFYNSSATFMA